MDFEKAEEFILNKIKSELPSDLHYHGVHHTLDVFNAASYLAKEEHINADDALLLKTAALFHDSGIIIQYINHEEAGCKIAREHLPKFGYDANQIEKICGMIMATKVPQQPQNHLEEIICDADLDYLGRDDFYPIAETLFKEFLIYKVVKDEDDWNRMQIRFFESHHYFTKTANALRGEKKMEHLVEIKKIMING